MLRYEDVPDPVCAPNGVVIDVRAIGIEGGDVLNRAGGALAARPHIVGYNCAGVVAEVGAAGDRPQARRPRDRADDERLARRARGGAGGATWLVPDGLSFEHAACVPVAWGTAHDCLFEFGRLAARREGARPGGLERRRRRVRAARQARGRDVCSPTGSEDKLERLRELGVDHGIDYREADFVDGGAGAHRRQGRRARRRPGRRRHAAA